MRTTTRHSTQDIHWWPASRAGSWAVGLAGLAVAGTVATIIAFALGVERADGFTDTDHWAISLTGAGVLASAAASLAAGIDALVRRHDRAWLVVTAVVVGGLITLLMLQQVAEGLGWLSG